jgi:16S rRNA (cytosine1402-N4)-methyltransferase
MTARDSNAPSHPESPRRRRLRYAGTNPRRYDQKYKELDPGLDPGTIRKVIASGKTPAGQHRPILVENLLHHLSPQPGDRGADVTFGYGGHSEALLSKLGQGGRLLALDVDAVQLPRTEARLRALGYGDDSLIVRRCNYAGLAKVLPEIGWEEGVDFLIADLGLSSMQIDNPARGFSYKHDGPLDMRMNPERGVSARVWLARCQSSEKLARVLMEGSDEPNAERIADAILSAKEHATIATTQRLRGVIEAALPEHFKDDERRSTVARVFQAIRVFINDEFGALEAFLRHLPSCLKHGGRVAILTFHSGEDRRVKHHFRDGHRSALYSEISPDVIRPTPREIGENSRAAPAKMRWAIRA